MVALRSLWIGIGWMLVTRLWTQRLSWKENKRIRWCKDNPRPTRSQSFDKYLRRPKYNYQNNVVEAASPDVSIQWLSNWYGQCETGGWVGKCVLLILTNRRINVGRKKTERWKWQHKNSIEYSKVECYLWNEYGKFHGNGPILAEAKINN